jgi:TRAP transporter 4TM/12TM fusion protein
MLIVRQTVVLSGIFGFLSRIGATWIAIFIIFAGIVEGYGGFEYIRKIGAALARRSRSMVAQTAIVASMFMGTMMGSSASNVATTGSFTIPLMKRQGISTRTAGAAEALASTGGQILPPIMGTAAFIMADILGISFGTVALGATIPAILYYVAVSLGIHYAIRKEGFVSETDSASVDTEALLDIDELPDRRTLALQGVQYLIPVSVLVVLLMILQYGPMNAGLYTIASLLVVRAVKAGFNRTPVEFVTNTVRGLYIGGKNLAPFMAILASLGIVIDIISGTGLGHTIAISTVQFAGQNVAIIVVVVMIVCLLFGLGLPTPAAYVLVATILAPLLIEQGVQPLPAHLFIFYFALLSAITPPVALAVAVAVGVSGGNFYRTAKKTLQIGGPLFVLPYLFLLNPAVVLVEYPDALVQFVALGSAVVSAVSALLGVNGSRILSYPERAGFAAVFVLVAAGSVFGTAYQAAGVALFLLLVVAYLLVTDAYGTLLNSDRLVDRLHGQ